MKCSGKEGFADFRAQDLSQFDRSTEGSTEHTAGGESYTCVCGVCVCVEAMEDWDRMAFQAIPSQNLPPKK